MPPETSYGSIPVTSSTGEEETLPLTADDTLEVQKQRWFSKGAWRSAWATFLVIGALVLVGVVLHSLQHREMVVPTTVSYYKGDPFQVSPVDHLGKVATVRHKDAAPSVIWGRRDGPLPTNSWYLVRTAHSTPVFFVSNHTLYFRNFQFSSCWKNRTHRTWCRTEPRRNPTTPRASILFLTLSTRPRLPTWRACVCIGRCPRRTIGTFKSWTTLKTRSVWDGPLPKL